MFDVLVIGAGPAGVVAAMQLFTGELALFMYRHGGPLLAPRISPKKTWAGAIGGLAGGVVAGGVVAYASAGTQPVAAGYMANAYVRMRHPDYDALHDMLDDVGRTIEVYAN